MIDGKRPAEITADDLHRLIEAGYAENRTIEYKRNLSTGNRDEKRELLADISSFANSSGGYLIFGIEEREGAPVALTGIERSADEAQLAMEDLIRSGISPRIPGIEMAPVLLDSSISCLVMYIPRSWALPHAVTLGGSSMRFYARGAAGKFPLDIAQVRDLFAMSGSMAERLQSLRAERIATVLRGDGPLPLVPGPRALLHVIPAQATVPGNAIDVKWFGRNSMIQALHNISGGFTSWHYNADGVLTYVGPDTSGFFLSYVHLFRSGVIEAADTSIVTGRVGDDPPLIPSSSLEERLLKAVPQHLGCMRLLQLPPPYFVSLTLLGVKGRVLAVSEGGRGQPLDREVIVLPDVIADRPDADAAVLLQPILDGVWQASGFEGSANYSGDGEYRSSR